MLCYQLSDGVLDHFEPVADDALSVVLHQVLTALTSLQLHKHTHTQTRSQTLDTTVRNNTALHRQEE